MFATDIQPAELHAALVQAVATGQAGTLVSARMHWQLPFTASLDDGAVVAVEMLDRTLQMTTTHWRIRRSKLGSLLHALGTDDRGRTLVITVNHGPTSEAQLTVFGNHGVVRLDRADLQWSGQLPEARRAASQSLQATLMDVS